MNYFIIDQINPNTGAVDEHKVVMPKTDTVQLDTVDAALWYLSNYEPNWQGLGAISEVTPRAFNAWMEFGDKSKPFSNSDFAEKTLDLAMVGDAEPDPSKSRHWITTEHGSHILINGKGEVVSGAGGALKDKKFSVPAGSKDVSKHIETVEKIAQAGYEKHGGDKADYLRAGWGKKEGDIKKSREWSSAAFAREYEKKGTLPSDVQNQQDDKDWHSLRHDDKVKTLVDKLGMSKKEAEKMAKYALASPFRDRNTHLDDALNKPDPTQSPIESEESNLASLKSDYEAHTEHMDKLRKNGSRAESNEYWRNIAEPAKEKYETAKKELENKKANLAGETGDIKDFDSEDSEYPELHPLYDVPSIDEYNIVENENGSYSIDRRRGKWEAEPLINKEFISKDNALKYAQKRKAYSEFKRANKIVEKSNDSKVISITDPKEIKSELKAFEGKQISILGKERQYGMGGSNNYSLVWGNSEQVTLLKTTDKTFVIQDSEGKKSTVKIDALNSNLVVLLPLKSDYTQSKVLNGSDYAQKRQSDIDSFKAMNTAKLEKLKLENPDFASQAKSPIESQAAEIAKQHADKYGENYDSTLKNVERQLAENKESGKRGITLAYDPIKLAAENKAKDDAKPDAEKIAKAKDNLDSFNNFYEEKPDGVYSQGKKLRGEKLKYYKTKKEELTHELAKLSDDSAIDPALSGLKALAEEFGDK